MLTEWTKRKVYESIEEGIPLYFIPFQKWFKNLSEEDQKIVKETYDTITLEQAKGWLKIK